MDKIIWHRILIDIVLLLALSAIYGCLKYLVEPSKTGFHCNDYSINYAYKSSTVNNVWLFVISTIVPIAFMLGTEIARTLYQIRKRSKSNNSYHIGLLGSREIRLREQFGNMFMNLVYFLFGLLATVIVTQIGKVTVGRLRPNFLDVCKPAENPFLSLCQTGRTGRTYLVPEVDFECTEPNKKKVSDSRKSFPSGHSSTTFYAMIFLIFYIHRVWIRRGLGLLPQFFQIIFFALAFLVGIIRVLDNKHHPTDVLAGASLGIIIAVFTAYYLDLFYRKYNYRHKYELVQTSYQMAAPAQVDSESAE
jgi:phosphatidate phosphatase